MTAPSIGVRAYDVNSDAQRLCKEMAELNHVSERITVGGRFRLSDLAGMQGKGQRRLLMLVDCEGAEAAIFSSESYRDRHLLVDATIIIESHEFVQQGIADHLIAFFAESHRLQRILAVGDLLRPSFYSSFLPSGCSRAVASMLLDELRPAPMEWLVFAPHSTLHGKQSSGCS